MEEATTYAVTCFQWAQDERSKPVSTGLYVRVNIVCMGVYT